jgi:hypothetical protein
VSGNDSKDDSRESAYFRFGKRIGYWYAANRTTVNDQVKQMVLNRLPGGRFLSKLR